MDEEKLQIITDNVFETDLSAIMKQSLVREFASLTTRSNTNMGDDYARFHGQVIMAAGKCINQGLAQFVPAERPNFVFNTFVHNNEHETEWGNEDEWQLHGFYVIEADDNTYINIQGVDLRVKFNHMYIMTGKTVYKYLNGSNVKLITMKWKLKSYPFNRNTMKEWR
jgi:hypothetical protein